MCSIFVHACCAVHGHAEVVHTLLAMPMEPDQVPGRRQQGRQEDKLHAICARVTSTSISVPTGITIRPPTDKEAIRSGRWHRSGRCDDAGGSMQTGMYTMEQRLSKSWACWDRRQKTDSGPLNH